MAKVKFITIEPFSEEGQAPKEPIQIPVRVGYQCLMVIKETHNKSVAKLSMDDLEVYGTLFIESVKSGYRAMRKECPYSEEDLIDFFEDCMFEFMKLIPGFFPNEGGGNPKPSAKV